MRYFLTAALLAMWLAGCSSSSSKATPAPPTATPTPHTFARVEKIPQTTPPPVKSAKGYHPPGTGSGAQHKTKQGARGGALPTLKPITFATPTPFPPSAYSAVIQGTVTDAKTHSPLAGALITVGSNNHVTLTGPFGRYRLSFPAGPPVPVQVTMKGYAGQLAMGSLSPHKKLTLDFKLTSIKPGHPAAPPAPTFFGNH